MSGKLKNPKNSGVGKGNEAEVAKLSPNKVREAIDLICRKHLYDPFTELIEIATGYENTAVVGKDGVEFMVRTRIASVQQRIDIAKELASYMAPKLKSMEVVGQIDNTLHITIEKVGDDGKTKIIELNNPKDTFGSGQDLQRLVADGKMGNSSTRTGGMLDLDEDKEEA